MADPIAPRVRAAVAAWRSLAQSERTQALRAQAVDEAVRNMSMEGEPAVAGWNVREGAMSLG